MQLTTPGTGDKASSPKLRKFETSKALPLMCGVYGLEKTSHKRLKKSKSQH